MLVLQCMARDYMTFHTVFFPRSVLNCPGEPAAAWTRGTERSWNLRTPAGPQRLLSQLRLAP